MPARSPPIPPPSIRGVDDDVRRAAPRVGPLVPGRPTLVVGHIADDHGRGRAGERAIRRYRQSRPDRVLPAIFVEIRIIVVVVVVVVTIPGIVTRVLSIIVAVVAVVLAIVSIVLAVVEVVLAVVSIA